MLIRLPSLRARIVQWAVLMAREPIWESNFHATSYGFRPARGIHHAIRTVKLQLQDSSGDGNTGRWVIEGDLASYFDTVSQEWLTRFLEQRIGDTRIIPLVQKWLKAGVLNDGALSVSEAGVHRKGQWHVSHNGAKFPFEIVVSFSRKQLRPSYGQVFRTAWRTE